MALRISLSSKMSRPIEKYKYQSIIGKLGVLEGSKLLVRKQNTKTPFEAMSRQEQEKLRVSS